MQGVKIEKVIDGVTETTTSSSHNIANAVSVAVICQRSNHGSGSSAFSLEVSPDGVNWITYNKLRDNVANSNVQEETRLASKVLSSDSIDFVTTDFEIGLFQQARVKVTETTDGTHTAWLIIRK